MIGNKSALYLTGLNRTRAIAALAVMLSHINRSLNNFYITSYSLFGFENGVQSSWVLAERRVTIYF